MTFVFYFDGLIIREFYVNLHKVNVTFTIWNNTNCMVQETNCGTHQSLLPYIHAVQTMVDNPRPRLDRCGTDGRTDSRE